MLPHRGPVQRVRRPITGLQSKRAIRNITDAAEKALRQLWINRSYPWTTQVQDTSQGLISPGWATWARGYDVERPKTLNDPRLHH